MSVLKDKNRGTWAYHGYYRDVTGVRHQYHQRGFATKREAKEAETGFLLAARKKRPGITLNELVLLYRENFPALGIKESTLISNESYYKNHIQEHLGAARIDSLTAPAITRWLSLLAKQKQENGQPFSVATVNKSRDVLSKYLSYAVRLGYLEYNPAECTYETKKCPCDFWDSKTGECLLGDCKPESCKKYPYTDQPDRIGSLLSIIDNASICPVVYEILERLKEEYHFRKRAAKNIP